MASSEETRKAVVSRVECRTTGQHYHARTETITQPDGAEAVSLSLTNTELSWSSTPAGERARIPRCSTSCASLTLILQAGARPTAGEQTSRRSSAWPCGSLTTPTCAKSQSLQTARRN